MNRIVWMRVICWVFLASQSSVQADNNTVLSSPTPIELAYQSGRSNLQVSGEGIVIKLLPDDNRGNRHQRFIIQLESGQTLLIAHNIELASKIEPLGVGDRVMFFGEYEWGKKGGIVHWTHHDPQHRHVAGWLKHNGQLYQ